jgi:serine/threonine-protein kinase
MGALSGRQLADYELGALRGEDEFGLMYEARHLNLGRSFALRVLSDQFTFAQGFEENFWRVTQVLSALEHANLLTLDDFGMDGPYAYLVTPLVEGLTLDAWLRQRPGQAVNPAQVLRLFGQMLAGLGHAHQVGVTHLGLTPRHLLIQPNGHLLIANFGLPHLAEQLLIAWNGSRSFGDPLYLAPEQMPGRTPDGVAADLYALGVVLYRLLTGALPFEGAPQAILSAKLAGPPSLLAKRPELPAPLETLVQRALAPSPADRWPNAAALSGAFYQALGQANPLPSSSPPAGAPGALLGSGGDVSPGSASGFFSGGASERREPVPPAQPPAGPPALKGEPSVVVAFSSAGKGRVGLPPPPPGWRPEGAWPQSEPLRAPGFLRRLGIAAFKVLALLVLLALLGFAIFYGYQRLVQLQHQIATPTPTAPSPTPKHQHRQSFSAETALL